MRNSFSGVCSVFLTNEMQYDDFLSLQRAIKHTPNANFTVRAKFGQFIAQGFLRMRHSQVDAMWREKIEQSQIVAENVLR